MNSDGKNSNSHPKVTCTYVDYLKFTEINTFRVTKRPFLLQDFKGIIVSRVLLSVDGGSLTITRTVPFI